jgi:predicted nucleotidyltransferase
MDIFEKYKKEIFNICLKYDVKTLIAFGSVLTNSFDETSDIDFLIEFNNNEKTIKNYMDIKFELEELFKREVDLVMPNAIKNKRIKKYIYSNTRKIYAA